MSKWIKQLIFDLVYHIYFSVPGILNMLKHDARFVYLLEIAIFPTHLITRIHVEQSML